MRRLLQTVPNLSQKLFKILTDIGEQDRFRSVKKYQKLTSSTVVGKPVVVHKFNLKEDVLQLIPLFDVHWGLRTTNEEAFLKTVEHIANTPNCFTILGGDLMESATRQSVGLGIFDEKMHVQEQRHSLTEILRPLAEQGKILGGVTGNHEMRVQLFNNENPMAELCYDLNVPYWGYSAFLKLVVNDIIYHVYVHHGSSSASTRSGKMNAALRFGQVANADLYLSGHTHDRLAVPEIIYEIDDETDTLVAKKRTYVVVGSFVEYFGGYAEMKGLSPAPTGAVLVELNGKEKDIRVYL